MGHMCLLGTAQILKRSQSDRTLPPSIPVLHGFLLVLIFHHCRRWKPHFAKIWCHLKECRVVCLSLSCGVGEMSHTALFPSNFQNNWLSSCEFPAAPWAPRTMWELHLSRYKSERQNTRAFDNAIQDRGLGAPGRQRGAWGSEGVKGDCVKEARRA